MADFLKWENDRSGPDASVPVGSNAEWLTYAAPRRDRFIGYGASSVGESERVNRKSPPLRFRACSHFRTVKSVQKIVSEDEDNHL